MYNFGKDRDNLTVRISTHLKAYIAARGGRVNASKSEYGGWIYDWWIAMGAPAVHEHELDKTFLAIPAEVSADKTPGILSSADAEDFPLADADELAKREIEKRSLVSKRSAKPPTPTGSSRKKPT